MLNTGILTHGGIMVNYQCNAACRHCLYSCSPTRSPGYVREEDAQTICGLLRKGGCRSVHIGGGEPFLDFDGLLMVVRKLTEAGIALEYVETNAYWATGDQSGEKLERLLAAGASTLCISIDPYHAEYIPYGAPLALAEQCEKTGMNYFLWKQEFLRVLARMDPYTVHSRADIETAIGSEYIHKTARLYGIGYGGRAINIERETGALHPAEQFAADNAPCRNLLFTGHFHVDKDCYFIPPRCTGIRIPLAEAIDDIPAGKYPVFEALYNGGLAALFELARQCGFIPQSSGYPSKCGLCFQLRRFLLAKNDYAELDRNHYDEALRYY